MYTRKQETDLGGKILTLWEAYQKCFQVRKQRISFSHDTEQQKDAACLAKRRSSRASYCKAPPPHEQGPFSGHNSHSR
uniref:Uncharacterized protein n=1 Tax=Castor canadensis TaxID=51338 RepID=A0A8C0XGQ1_CASCN